MGIKKPISYEWKCFDCEKISHCWYFKWVNLFNSTFINPNRIIVECKHYEREGNEK